MVTGSLEDLKSPKFWLAVFAEFLGTLLLVLVACGSCGKFISQQPTDLVQISLAFGLSVATIVWSIAHISGGHINPAVTFGFLVTRRISIVRALLYMVSQTAGAVVGAGLLYAVTPQSVNDSLGFTFPPLDLPNKMAVTFLIELLITFVLVLTVFATCDSHRQGFNGSGPLAIGLSVSMCHLWAIPYTGSGMNPARAFGPAAVTGSLKSHDEVHFLYWFGPLLGGALAALLYDHLFAVNASLEKTKAFFTRRDYDDSDFDSRGRKPAGDDSANKSDIRLKDVPAA